MEQRVQSAQTSPASVNALRLAETHQLGSILTVHKNDALKWGLYGLVLGIICFGVAVLGVVLPVSSGLATAMAGIGGILGLFLFFGGLYQLFSGLRNWRTEIYVCMNGLLKIQGKQTEVVRWDQLTEVRKKFVNPTKTMVDLDPKKTNYTLTHYVLRQANGQEMQFSAYLQSADKLGKVIEQHVTERLLPGAIATYQAGSPVDFGWIRVSQEGIGIRRAQRIVPWNGISKVWVRNGIVVIEKDTLVAFAVEALDLGAGGPAILTDNQPNVCVFVELLRAVGHGDKLDT